MRDETLKQLTNSAKVKWGNDNHIPDERNI